MPRTLYEQKERTKEQNASAACQLEMRTLGCTVRLGQGKLCHDVRYGRAISLQRWLDVWLDAGAEGCHSIVGILVVDVIEDVPHHDTPIVGRPLDGGKEPGEGRLVHVPRACSSRGRWHSQKELHLGVGPCHPAGPLVPALQSQ